MDLLKKLSVFCHIALHWVPRWSMSRGSGWPGRTTHIIHKKTTYITDLKTYFRDTSKYISPIYILKVRHSKTDLNFLIPSAQHQRGEIARGSRLWSLHYINQQNPVRFLFCNFDFKCNSQICTLGYQTLAKYKIAN